MRPDEIIGIAVLAEFEPGRQRLFIQLASEQRKIITQSAIRVTQKGIPHKYETHEPVWEYEQSGDVLTVTPSVHRLGGGNPPETLFHNEALWTVKFVKAKDDYPGDEARTINDVLRQDFKARMKQ